MHAAGVDGAGPGTPAPLDDGRTRHDLPDAVDMTAPDLRTRLDTDESASVGDDGDGGGPAGQAMGRHIVTLLRTVPGGAGGRVGHPCSRLLRAARARRV